MKVDLDPLLSSEPVEPQWQTLNTRLLKGKQPQRVKQGLNQLLTSTPLTSNNNKISHSVVIMIRVQRKWNCK